MWEYLNAKRDYERLQRQIEEIETSINNIGIDYTRVRVQSSPKDHLAESVDKLHTLKKQSEEKAVYMAEMMDRCLKDIESVDNAFYRDLLERRYIQGQTWDQIAEAMGRSWRHIQRVHQSALKMADKEKK